MADRIEPIPRAQRACAVALRHDVGSIGRISGARPAELNASNRSMQPIVEK
jgi:hypothetical protein